MKMYSKTFLNLLVFKNVRNYNKLTNSNNYRLFNLNKSFSLLYNRNFNTSSSVNSLTEPVKQSDGKYNEILLNIECKI